MSNTGYIQLGKRLKALREAAGLSQADVAGIIGLSRTSITNIEAGRQRFMAHLLWEFAAIYDVDPVLIFSDKISDQSDWVRQATLKQIERAEAIFARQIQILREELNGT